MSPRQEQLRELEHAAVSTVRGFQVMLQPFSAVAKRGFPAKALQARFVAAVVRLLLPGAAEDEAPDLGEAVASDRARWPKPEVPDALRALPVMVLLAHPRIERDAQVRRKAPPSHSQGEPEGLVLAATGQEMPLPDSRERESLAPDSQNLDLMGSEALALAPPEQDGSTVLLTAAAMVETGREDAQRLRAPELFQKETTVECSQPVLM